MKSILVCNLMLAALAAATSSSYWLFEEAANLQPTERLSLQVPVLERMQFTCASPCGYHQWEINHQSTFPVDLFVGPAILDNHKVAKCNVSSGSCRSQSYLNCDQANHNIQLLSTVTIRPLQDLTIQCVCRLVIGKEIIKKYSRAIIVKIIHASSSSSTSFVPPSTRLSSTDQLQTLVVTSTIPAVTSTIPAVTSTIPAVTSVPESGCLPLIHHDGFVLLLAVAGALLTITTLSLSCFLCIYWRARTTINKPIPRHYVEVDKWSHPKNQPMST